jgi:hypothetical protein
MSKLSNPDLQFRVPFETVERTMLFLRNRGKSIGHEGVVLWPAQLQERVCLVSPAPIIPAQITGPKSYRIPTDECFRVIEFVHRNRLVIPIQVHSHPSEAFHSEADDEMAFVQHRNGVSIVVPDFADFSVAHFLQKAKFYILVVGVNWSELSERARCQKFVFEGLSWTG